MKRKDGRPPRIWTTAEKTEICRLVASGVTQLDVAKKFSTFQGNISRIVLKNKLWQKPVDVIPPENSEPIILLRTKIREAERQIQKWEKALQELQN